MTAQRPPHGGRPHGAQAGLELDDPTRPVPTRPTWFDTQGGQENRQAFADLAELARHVVRLAPHGLRLAERPSTTAACGLELFPAWSLYALDEFGGEAWLGQAATQATPRERLAEALRQARQQLPPQRSAA